MPNYVFVCACGHRELVIKTTMAEGAPAYIKCAKCQKRMRRDWRGERVAVHIPDEFRAINPATGKVN